MPNKDEDDFLSFDTLDIRAISVDRLSEDTEHNIQARLTRLQTWKDRGYKIVETLKERYETAQQNYLFVEREHAGAQLALLLRRGEKVRVDCPDCGGTGLRAEDVSSGQYKQYTGGTAFSAAAAPVRAQPPTPTDRQKCQRCEGNRWLVMNRFRG